ncbi:D-2-hydroxyacid dehydrogenase [Vibrio breoganii]|uniref:D-2-hydroxyacid dehydrogenase n=1 Tax=Vibrio breoganii TaxID=553239 RepID=UPI00080E0C2E|nr:D-2-hydroxyacid dehydrogenase [Vibrio breoganii]OCH73217.1 2-ketoacid reductase [Vibrio breoganii]PMK32960.1 2-ketoacid reductase [Vibrio breoganii]PMK34857.1 2-ketoacid reductase [Vibrio breoganii]PML22900.1 2-ketoacid reductase [Vibrio breoganii]
MKTATQYLYVLSKNKQEYLELLKSADLPQLEITEDPTLANILLASPPMASEVINDFPNLEWVQSIYAGVDALTQPAPRSDYQLTNVKDIFGQPISEYVLSYSIAHFRHFATYKQQQAEQVWQPYPYVCLNEKTLVILGTGSIGAHLSNVAKAFGLTTIGVNSSGKAPENSQFDSVFPISELNHALSLADIVVSVLPKTAQTKGVLNKQSLSHCKQALLFNVGRGDAIETDGLLSALEEGCLEHAYLDVFINEPISQQCPYWQNPKVTVTPHIAAHSFPNQVMGLFKDNYQRWLNDEPLKAIVDFNKGY